MIEDREKSLQAVGIDDIFGSGMRSQQMLHMAEMEAAAEDMLLVILSDLHLDKPLVREQELQQLPLSFALFWIFNLGLGKVSGHPGRIRSQRCRPTVRIDRIFRIEATVQVAGGKGDNRGRIHRFGWHYHIIPSSDIKCQIFIRSW